MLIEFVGLSGSGKSTVTESFMKMHNNFYPGRPSMGAGMSIWIYRARYAYCFPRFLITTMQLEKNMRTVDHDFNFKVYIRIAVWAFFSYCFKKDKRRNIVDQGFLQYCCFLAVSLEGKARKHFLNLVIKGYGKFSIPDVVCFLDVAPELSAARTKMNGSNFKEAERLERFRGGISDMLNIVSKNSHVISIPVMHSDSPKSVVKKFSDHVEGSL
ncbi:MULTISPECIES: hypothetical protein [Halomonadaceae]|uniref:hypothetical protein n=1 Tax=Halomonadaceae TaxID=28256 RepID=UPI00159A877E|nr:MULTISPECIES: hypothetical protein [Halomonas]QJQ94010.1 hypothetical protein HIO72_00980 [Halomonas sp. PA5]